MLSVPLQLAVGVVPLLILVIAVAVRPLPRRPSIREQRAGR